jgi:L-asparaginase
MKVRKPKKAILLIYTGGTIGMIHDSKTGVLKPFNFEQLEKQIPEIKGSDLVIRSVSVKKPVDSSNFMPENWIEIAQIIKNNYDDYEGFVVLHGSDTMAYTASALGFMLENLSKPVIFTGSQLPIGNIRTDAKEHLITAVQIASATTPNGEALVPEVCIYFDYKLMRGNRTRKHNSAKFEAFTSPNYPSLAQAGIDINYRTAYILPQPHNPLHIHQKFDTNVGVIKLFPGITQAFLRSFITTPDLKAVVLEAFGAGNAPTQQWFLDTIQEVINAGILVVAITQCTGGAVTLGKYETSLHLKNMGVINGGDMTFEACITKLMFLLAQNLTTQQVKIAMETNLRGEMT